MRKVRQDADNPIRPGGGAAFTLVELLVVLSIVALLATIATPAISQYMRAARQGASLAVLQQIEGACLLYKGDFEQLPPSSGGGAYPGWQGCQLVVLFLTGYGPDNGNDAAPGGDLYSDDGQEGFGFRIERRGRLYPPYNGAEKIDMARGTGARPYPYFVDAWGNPICYYRYDGGYSPQDNTGPPGDGPTALSYAKDQQGRYYRKDLWLCSRGHNRVWNPPSGGGKNDDVTNFFFR